MSTIEHELKLLLNSPTLKLISQTKLPPTTFSKKYSNTKTALFFLTSLHDKENIEVPLYSINLDYTKLKHKVYYCEVAIGKSLFVTRKYANMFQPPDEYDSFMVEMDTEDGSLRQAHLDLGNEKTGYEKYIENKNNQRNSEDSNRESKNKDNIRERNNDDGSNYRNGEGRNRERNNEDNSINDKRTWVSSQKSEGSERTANDIYNYVSERGYNSAGSSEPNSRKSHDKKKNIDNQSRGSSGRDSSKELSTKELSKELSKISSKMSNASQGRDSPFPRTFSPKPIEDLTNTNPNLNNLYYIIKDQSKINPLYVIEFEYDRMLDEKEKYLCEMCQQNPSIMFCLAERASFCKFCDKSIHDNEFTQRHKRYYYDHKKDSTVAMCSVHYEEKLEEFCKLCHASFCKDCVVDQCPEAPDKKHDLVDFGRGCELIKNELDHMKSDLDKINCTVLENISKYQLDLKEFNNDVSKARYAIEMDCQNALNMLNNLVRQKYQIYNALYIEKVVVKEKMKRMVDFVENAETVEMVKEYNNFKETKNKIDVQPERIKKEKIIVKGEIKVFCGDEKVKDEIYVDSSYRKNRY